MKYFLISFLTILFFQHNDLSASQTVLLKNGKSMKGTIVSQDADGLTIESEEGDRSMIPKSILLKVIYREVDEVEKEKIRKEEEEKLAEKERLEAEEKRRKQEEKRRILEEKRKEFEEKKKTELQSLEEELSKRKKQSDSSQKFKNSDYGYMTQYELSQVFSNAEIKLAPTSASCKEYSKSSDWYWLFGTFPITRPDREKLFPKDGSLVRIRAENNWIDVGTSTLLGFLGTVTRRTLIVESCGSASKTKLYTEDELKLELEKQKFQLKSEFMKEKEELLLLKGDEE